MMDPASSFFISRTCLRDCWVHTLCWYVCLCTLMNRQALESNVFQQWIKYMTGHNGILNLGGNGGTRCSLKKVTIQVILRGSEKSQWQHNFLWGAFWSAVPAWPSLCICGHCPFRASALRASRWCSLNPWRFYCRASFEDFLTAVSPFSNCGPYLPGGQNVDFFGPRVGFVKFKAEVIDEETGAKVNTLDAPFR